MRIHARERIMMILFMQIWKKFSLLLMLSFWIIYAKRTTGEKKRRWRKKTMKRLSITFSQKKMQTRMKKKRIFTIMHNRHYLFFCFYSIYLLCLSTTDSHFFSSSVSCVRFPICARRIKKKRKKEKKKQRRREEKKKRFFSIMIIWW